jgi:hypothetical protein
MTDPISAEVAEVRERLAYLLRVQCVPAEPHGEAGFRVPLGSALVHLDLLALDHGLVALDVWAAVVDPVVPSASLHRFAAEFQGLFGKMVVEPNGDGGRRLAFRHRVLADPLSPEVVMPLLSIVAHTVDDLDDSLAEQFGAGTG